MLLNSLQLTLTLLTAQAAPPPADPAIRAPEISQSGPTMDIEALDLAELLDTKISSVSRKEEKSALAPAAVFVVSGDELRRQGFRTLAEALRSIPGFFIHDDGFYAIAGVRGIAPLGDLTTRILILLDGHPLNNSVGVGQSYIDRDLPVGVTAIERIEVIKGPVGSIYGPIAYFGVVNVVTRTADEGHAGDLRVGGELAQAAPTAGEFSANYRGKANEVSWTLNLDAYRSRGFTYAFPELEGQDRDVPAGGVVSGADWRWSHNAYGTLQFRDFKLALGWSQRDKGTPTAPYSTIVGDPRNHFYNRTGFAQLSWEHKLGDLVSLYARASYDDFHYGDDLAYPEPPDDFGLFYDLGTDRWFSGELRAQLTPLAGHRDVIGLDFQRHDTLQQSQYHGLPNAVDDPIDGFGNGPLIHPFNAVNAYVLVEQSLLENRLLLQGGLTFYTQLLDASGADAAKTISRLTPKLAAVFAATPDDTVKGIYSEGFRPPTMFETYFDDGLDFTSNSTVLPESARSFELSYERRIQGVATVALGLYHAQYTNLIRSTIVPAPGLDHDPDPNEPSDFRSQFQNLGSMSTTGGELTVHASIKRWLQAYGGISVQFGDFSQAEESASNFAPVTANLALSTNALWDPLSISLNGVFVSARAKDPETVVIPGDRDSVDPYLLLNLSARLEAPWMKGLQAQLTLFNLLDSPATDPLVGDHAPLSELRHGGRELRLDVEYHF